MIKNFITTLWGAPDKGVFYTGAMIQELVAKGTDACSLSLDAWGLLLEACSLQLNAWRL